MLSEMRTWDEAMSTICNEQDELIRDGRWRNGQRTLLQAIGLQYDEVKLCAGVAWLLRPDSWHGLGARFLDVTLQELGFSSAELGAAGLPRAIVTVEEPRDDTRADIVIRVPNLSTVLIEAKVRADEQDDQADRLHRLWSDEEPRLVYLTRHGGLPNTAANSKGLWSSLTWSRLHELLMPLRADASAGARELIDTIGFLGGGQRANR